jgi:peptidylprolyl isomerase
MKTGAWAAAVGLVLAGPALAVAEMIGRAGSAQIDDSEVRTLVAALPEASRAAVARDAAAMEKLIRADLVRRVILQEAKAAGFDRRPETIAALSSSQNEIVTELWLASKSQVPGDFPAEPDIAAAYAQNRSALTSASEYHVAQIFLSAPDAGEPAKLAQAVRKLAELAPRLAAPAADFGRLARENSDQAESATKDGDLGWLTEDQILPQIAGALRQLKVGETSGPVKTTQGFHFLKLLDQRPGKALTLSESHDRLRAALRSRKAQELNQAYLEGLAGRAAVSINQIALANLRTSLK